MKNSKFKVKNGWGMLPPVALVAFELLILTLSLAGCLTVTEKATQPAMASLDGNAANSGLVSFNADGSGNLTQGGRDRFVWLQAHYGARLIPPLLAGVGLSTGTNGTPWIIDAERLDAFQKMTFLANNPAVAPGAMAGKPK
jgi:hypothetical protein